MIYISKKKFNKLLFASVSCSKKKATKFWTCFEVYPELLSLPVFSHDLSLLSLIWTFEIYKVVGSVVVEARHKKIHMTLGLEENK